MIDSRKLALGTAQFGLPYGIANRVGQVSRGEISQILDIAAANEIDTLDTAAVYGDSESVLGEIGTDRFNIVTKLPPLPVKIVDVEVWVEEQVYTSLHRLNVDAVYGLLLHRSGDLSGDAGQLIIRSLERMKTEGRIQKIGVSIYDPCELELVLQRWNIDLVQAPFNVIDQRLFTTGWLKKLYDLKIELHVRSIFLQGLLLMPREAIPENFRPWFFLFDRWHAWLQDNGISAAEGCLSFVESHPYIERIVIGIESRAQLIELLQAANSSLREEAPDLSCYDEKLINPSNWNLL